MSTIVVEPSGTIKLIYEDAMRGLIHEGRSNIRRVSHVEPTSDGQWEADLSPVNGPVFGPFDTRQEALDAEVAYLHNHVL